MPKKIIVASTMAQSMRWEELTEQAREENAMVAVLYGDGPGLVDLLDELLTSGEHDVLIEPTEGQPSWVGRVCRWWLENRQAALRIVMRVGEREMILEPNGETLTNPEWDEPPAVEKHLLICLGPRCLAKGSAESASALRKAIRQAGLDSKVLITQTGCLYPCNHAPVICIQPDMKWVGPVTKENVDEIVATWFADGE